MPPDDTMFLDTGFDSPIVEFVLGMKASIDGTHYASGTAVIIGKGLAITARHVIEDYFSSFDGLHINETQERNISGKFSLHLFQITNQGKTGLIWKVKHLWSRNISDIAILQLEPATEEAQHYQWRLPVISLLPPKVGERVYAFGFSSPSIFDDDSILRWDVEPKTSIGEVKEVHHRKRDESRLTFPCFQTNARYDGAMSGGPVFDERGRLCGLICSNMPPYEEGEEHLSYVTSLWPMMAFSMNLDREGHPPGVHYRMLDLAKDGFIRAEDWGRVTLNEDGCGNVIGVNIDQA